jgi:hypothetical protein
MSGTVTTSVTHVYQTRQDNALANEGLGFPDYKYMIASFRFVELDL